jgi:hypothetical protein
LKPLPGARHLSKSAVAPEATTRRTSEWSAYSQIAEGEREESLKACRDVTASIYPGLDVEREIRAVQRFSTKLGTGRNLAPHSPT